MKQLTKGMCSLCLCEWGLPALTGAFWDPGEQRKEIRNEADLEGGTRWVLHEPPAARTKLPLVGTQCKGWPITSQAKAWGN